VEHEKKALRRRLGRDPLFAAEHLPWLVSSVIRLVRNRVAARLGGRHRGRKLEPDWFRAADKLFERETTPAEVAGRLPSYPHVANEFGPAAKQIAHTVPLECDSEDYMAEQRWGFLTEALLSGSLDRRVAIERCMVWLESHADKGDLAWEPYSTGERLINLLVYLASMPAEERTRFVTPRLCEFLRESVAWIFRHVEYYGCTETNNHVLNNARALVVGGWVTGSEVAFSAGMQTFRRWLPELVSAGGFLRERSSHYQLVVLNWILDAWWFASAARSADCEEARFLGSYLHRMLPAGKMLCSHRLGLLACIGDVSPDMDPERSTCRLARLYPQHWQALAVPADRIRVVDDWFRLADGAATVIGNFPQGRMPKKFPTHGHNDFTSFAWLHDDIDILVDPGRYRYTADEVSLQQSAAGVHNLPTVDGLAPFCESLKTGAQWRPVPYAEAALEMFPTEAGVVLAHTGFARATPVTRHARTIELEANGLRVHDAFDGQGAADVEFHWQFGPRFVSFDASRSTMSGAGGEVSIEIVDLDAPDNPLRWNAKIRNGWISRCYGTLSPLLGLSLRSRVRLPARIVTRFRLRAAEDLRA
jgi:Heparinase II/III-like protein